MVLQRWDPFAEMRQMQETIDRLFSRWWGTPATTPEPETWTVPLDVVEEGDRFVVRASMPGVRPEDIDVTLEDGVLTIRGEIKEEHEGRDEGYLMRELRAGRFYRAIRLPESVDPDKVEAHYEHGVLTVTFPKVESKRARRLEIKVGGPVRAIEGKKREKAA